MSRMLGLILAAAIVAPLGAAEAAPVTAPVVPEAGVIKVADGCGRFWHRNPWGRCVPNRGYREHRRPPAVYFGFGPRWERGHRWDDRRDHHRRHRDWD